MDRTLQIFERHADERVAAARERGNETSTAHCFMVQVWDRHEQGLAQHARPRWAGRSSGQALQGGTGSGSGSATSQGGKGSIERRGAVSPWPTTAPSCLLPIDNGQIALERGQLALPKTPPQGNRRKVHGSIAQVLAP